MPSADWSLCYRYLLLIGQFEAVSFGDSLFASYVILPLQQRHDVMYRRAVWGEHSTVLRALTLPLEQVRGRSP